MFEVLLDPVARIELAEVYLTGVLNCKSVNDIDVFMQSLCHLKKQTVRGELYRVLDSDDSISVAEEAEIYNPNESESIENDNSSEWETDDEENELKYDNNASDEKTALSPVY